MKYIFVILGLIASVAFAQEKYSEEKWNQLKKMRQECIKTSLVDEKILAKAQDDGIFEHNDPMIDFFICFFKGQNFYDENNEYQPEFIKAKLINRFDPQLAEEVTKICTKEKLEDFRESVLKFAKCYHDELVKKRD